MYKREDVEPHIDIEAVPEGLRNDERFLKEKEELLSRLTDPDYLDFFAVHEYAHKYYLEKAGLSGFKNATPAIYYDGTNTNPFYSSFAGVHAEHYSPIENEPMFAVAKGLAAGGVSSRTLFETDYGGDTNDRRRWDEFCFNSYKEDLDERRLNQEQVQKVADDLWEQAQKAVTEDLNDPNIVAEIKKGAKELRPGLFPYSSDTLHNL